MKLVTHDGIFHADDVFAGAVLRLVWPAAPITRTRDAALIAAADLAFDVGGGAYDHHQRGGNGARDNGVPFAAFGLVWRVFGVEACRALMRKVPGALASVTAVALVAAAVDRLLVQPVDAADNGHSIHGPPTVEGVRGVSVSSLIAWMNDEAASDAAYEVALTWAHDFLALAVRQAVAQVHGAGLVRAAVAAAASGIAVLDQYVPDWQALACQSDACYVVYPSAGTWRVQGVPAVYGAPGVRKALPEAWGGLDGDALALLTGVADATFAHRGLFIAGAVSREGALALAQLAVA